MPLTLSSKNYLSGMKWSIKPKDVIDTVDMHLTYGVSENTIVDTHTITQGTVDGTPNVSLPLADDNGTFGNRSDMLNTYSEAGLTVQQGVATVRLSYIEGTYDIALKQPLISAPDVAFKISGVTTYITRGQKTPEDFYTNILNGNPYTYIAQNAKASENMQNSRSFDTAQRSSFRGGLLIDYTQQSIPLYPYIRKVTGNYTGTWDAYKNSDLVPSAADIFCNWDVFNPQVAPGSFYPVYSNWNTYRFSNKVRQGPAILPDEDARGELGLNNEDRFLPVNPLQFQSQCTVTKINDLKYRVYYKLPVRYMQAASARTFIPVPGSNAYDSYAWKDVISSIEITVYATKFDDTVEDIAYSLNASGNLTTDIKNVYPISFAQNDFITRDASWDGNPWSTQMSKYLLVKFQKGKYEIGCTVKADWVLRNNVHINTEMIVQDLSGNIVQNTSGTGNAIFRVKNIKKTFRGSEFVYELQLLEV